MAKKRTKKSSVKTRKHRQVEETKPKFPYTNTPGALRKFLSLVPQKPKPVKVNRDLLKSWGIGDSNAVTIIRVLKAVDLVSLSNEPTDKYEGFMHRDTGPAILGQEIRREYGPLFEASHAPHREDDSAIKNLFNIHSGGGERARELQIQTLKALCDYATFDGIADSRPNDVGVAGAPVTMTSNQSVGTNLQSNAPIIHIDLHIHLPENKSSREYQAIFEDIGHYIYGTRAANNE